MSTFIQISEPPDTESVRTEVVPTGIEVEATLVSGSSSLGCFIVVQSNKTSDYYRALLRGDGDRVSDVIPLPPVETSYTVIVYDLQQNGLPSRIPAIIITEVVQVNGSGTYLRVCILHIYVC